MTPVSLPNASVSSRLFAGICLAMVSAGTFMIFTMNRYMREQALVDAGEKAEIILKERLSTHAYINQNLKPAVFPLMEGRQDPGYFDPTWMSSTYAIREIHMRFASMNTTAYYYKESALNARSPENEADEYEAAFLRDLNRDAQLMSRSEIRTLNGLPYFVTIRRGESMEEACLRCHSQPDRAPRGLVEFYGAQRSFGRRVGETVSAVSIRVPLAAAYAAANSLSMRLSATLVGILVLVSSVWYALNKRLLIDPLRAVRDKAFQISTTDAHLGEAIPIPGGRELQELTEAFNRMSFRMKDHVDHLEQTVQERTVDLTRTNRELNQALADVKTLKGLLPICASCKKIRDDKGYWNQIEGYIRDHSQAEFSHSICPDCATELYPGIDISGVSRPRPSESPRNSQDRK